MSNMNNHEFGKRNKALKFFNVESCPDSANYSACYLVLGPAMGRGEWFDKTPKGREDAIKAAEQYDAIAKAIKGED